MNVDVTQLRQRATSTFAGFTSGQKTILAIAVAAVVVGGFMFTKWASAPTYAPLFSNLDAGDAAAMTEKLSAQGVSYQLADNGATVLVPQQKVHQLRLDMSAEGLPTGGSGGWAIIEGQGITTSQFRQRVDYQRAMEGELEKTIGVISGVAGVDVHLVMPAEDLFAKDSKHPTASVLVMNEPGKTLGSGQVQAVVHLVASSVEGLDPKQVTVTDDTGRVLASPDTDGMSAAAVDANTDKRRAFESSLATDIEALLAPVVGVGKAVVRVSADLDFDQRERTSETVDPERTAVVNEASSSEDYVGTNTGPTGVLGVDPLAVDPTGAQNTYTKEEASRQVAVSKVTENVREAPGSVERLSVAVLVDGNAGVVNDAEVQRLVSAAAGIRPERGDEVTVTAMAFDTTAADAAKKELEAADAAARQADTLALARTVGAVVIVLVVLALAYRSMKKAGVKRYPLAVPIDVPPADPELPSGAAQLQERTGEELAAELIELTEASDSTDVPELVLAGNQERQVVEAQIGALIDKQPDDVAQLLRGWLGDRRS